MVNRLPGGGDNNVWGPILNNFLLAEHNPDGTHAPRLDKVLGSMYRAYDYNVPLNSSPVSPCDVAINAFLATLRGYNRGVIAYFESGDYWISNPLVLSTVTSYIGMYGALGCKFHLTAGAPRGMVQIGVQGGPVIHDIAIDGIEFDGNGANITGTTGSAAIMSWATYRVRLRDCFVHDTFNSGTDFNQCGDVKVRGTDYDNCGVVRKTFAGSAGANAISIYQTSPDMTNYPSRGFFLENFSIRHVGDMGVGVQGDGSGQVSVTGVHVQDQMAGNLGSGWGYGVEVEPGDTHNNSKFTMAACSADNLPVGVSLTNTGNVTYTFDTMSLVGVDISNCDTAVGASGTNLSIAGGTWTNVKRGLIPTGSGKNWSFTGITGSINPTNAIFGPSAFSLIVGAGVTLDQVTIAECNFLGAQPTITDVRHAGVYTMYNGGGSIFNLKVRGNSFKSFVEGIGIMHTDVCELTDNTLLNCSDYGVDQVAGAQVYGSGGRIQGVVSGAIHAAAGSKWGAVGTNGWVGALVAP